MRQWFAEGFACADVKESRHLTVDVYRRNDKLAVRTNLWPPEPSAPGVMMSKRSKQIPTGDLPEMRFAVCDCEDVPTVWAERNKPDGSGMFEGRANRLARIGIPQSGSEIAAPR